MAVTGKVHCQRRLTQTDDDGVPGVCVLPAAVQEDHAGRCAAPAQRADSAFAAAGFDALGLGERTRRAGLFGVLGQQRELGESDQFVIGDLGHAPDTTNYRTAAAMGAG